MFTPSAEVCQELGSPDTPFLRLLNGPGGLLEALPLDTLVIRNGDASFVYIPVQDGPFIPPVPADRSKTLPFRKSNTPAEISRPMICFW